MVVRLTHRQKPDLNSYSMLALGRAFTLTGIAATLRVAWKLTVPDRIPYSLTGQSATLTQGSSGIWNVEPAPTFVEGAGGTYDISEDLPSLFVDGGIFDVSPSGSSLPSGMSLTSAGILSVGSAADGVTTGVVFGYSEPGALPVLTLHPTAAGTLPYMATVYPPEGVVPSGYILRSPDDTNLRSSVLSTWPDGSAQVMVLAGQTSVSSGVQKTINLRVGSADSSPLTTADIASKFTTGISVNFGSVLTLNSWGSPDRVWWANSQVICARYRLPITNKGDMEAVIDVHAFAGGRAFVEVVIENGKINAAAGTVTGTTTQTYTSATVSVNGTTIATVSTPTASSATQNSRISGTWAGGHEPFRSWYCSGWIGGDPGIDVTHDATSMMAHPWFFERAVASTETMQTKYAQSYDTYIPWAFCRLRMPNMSQGGEDQEIGLVSATQADYIITGDKYARRAVIETGKALHSADFHWRHTDGSVPVRSQCVGKNTTAGTWPAGLTNEPRWGGSTRDGSHVPNVGLVPFLCRPSPCFIECAQKEFIWHHTNYSSTDGSHSFDQARSRGWRPRNYASTIFLTPDSGTWNTGAQSDATRKTDYRTALVNNITYSRSMMNQAWNTYKHIWEYGLSSLNDQNPTRDRYQTSSYMHWLIAMSWHSIANGKVLRNADQTTMETAADEVMAFPLRLLNDAASYEWRAVWYKPTVGVQSGNTIVPQAANVVTEHFYNVTGTAPSAPGPWINFGEDAYNWQAGSTGSDATSVVNQLVAGTGVYYPEHTWFVLCCAVERGVSGAENAWSRVYGTSGNGGITNFSTWLAGFSNSYPQLNRFPRNK